MALFAKYEGIDGESTDTKHKKWIEMLSLDWGAHMPEGGGPSRRRGAAVVEDMVLTLGPQGYPWVKSGQIGAGLRVDSLTNF